VRQHLSRGSDQNDEFVGHTFVRLRLEMMLSFACAAVNHPKSCRDIVFNDVMAFLHSKEI
jgi:hypothetical protein